MRFDQNQKAFLSLRDQVGERTKRMVVWLGAGMSAGVGMPTWAGLKSILEDSADAKARTLDHAARTRMEKEILVSRRESNPWIAFKMLKELLGHTSYQDEIRRALAQAPRVEISSTYKDIWNLPIHGVLNLNIDRIASRAFQTIRPGASLIEFPGQQAASMTHALNSTRPFLANLHGDVESVNTWVFTHDELTKLVRFKGYQNFINSCISTYTILFLGITADDQAVGGNLEWFTKNRIDAGPHFWLTDRQDRETDLWAERAGIRVIRYTNPDGKHEQVDEFLHALLTFIPTDDESTISPVSLSTIKIDNKVKIQAPDALVREDTEVIREALNKRTTEILSVMTESSYREYENFCTEYDEAIHRAWYVSTKPGKNNVLGYTLNEEVARGAFGQVYRATSPSGEQVAVKVLLEEVRNNGDLLRSFRRGIRSMRILQQNASIGMVEYKEASEIPAFVAMAWIEGPNLLDAVKGRQIDGWSTKIRIGRDLAKIIGTAHALPERVLHRDLRPSNIMLKDFYSDPDDWKVVVLDFDLSWHRGAIERSVMHSTALGYLAPEQIRASATASTRHAAVDSFGFGMTMYFLFTGQDPIPEQHKHQGWQQTLRSKIGSRTCHEWKSVPTRVVRMIEFATQDEQSKRWDMGQLLSELTQLSQAISNPSTVESAELVAEELAAHCGSLSNYGWNFDRGAATTHLPSGIIIEVFGHEVHKLVRLLLRWGRTGMEERKGIGKALEIAHDRATQKLKSGGWTIEYSQVELGAVVIEAEIGLTSALKQLQRLADAINGACDHLRIG